MAGAIKLQLPDQPVPDRVSLTCYLPAHERKTFAELDGPGCIGHIWIGWGRQDQLNRQAIIRIYFDDNRIPYVEAPVGDFFGVMHGKAWYPINTSFLSVKAESGYNCYFAMPFAHNARIEIEAGEIGHQVYIMVDWHRYPGAELREPRRFCARWRREYPTERYGEDFLLLDADGPGQLLGFVYGVRLDDNTDRWSHGGSDNIYLDGEGEHPAYLRGIGGEDTFGTSYGGALHPPETHLYSAMPYYVHEDVGEARPAQRVVGYRFFTPDPLPFRHSLHMRFGCMRNDICATTYWYQESPVRPFFQMPSWDALAYLKTNWWDPERALPRGACDLPLPDSGDWWVCGPFGNQRDAAMRETLPAEITFAPDAVHDGRHEDGSLWLTEGSRALGRNQARWVRRAALHGFIDFNHVLAPSAFGVGVTHPGVAIARCVLHAPAEMAATLRLSWDDSLVLWVNDTRHDLGHHPAFRACSVEVPLRAGPNTVVIKLSNTLGTNHGGWAFAFRATTPDGEMLRPCGESL